MDLSQSYFALFELAQDFDINQADLTERYRELQKQLHPDRFAGASAQEQRLAVQYSGFVNEAYTTLHQPLRRALYMLSLAGMDQHAVSAMQVDGGFLMQQMELREKLESIPDLVDPDNVLEHLLVEIGEDMQVLQRPARIWPSPPVSWTGCRSRSAPRAWSGKRGSAAWSSWRL